MWLKHSVSGCKVTGVSSSGCESGELWRGGAGWDGGLFWSSLILGSDLALHRRALDNAVTGYLWSYPS